jgi:hypothetical protein
VKKIFEFFVREEDAGLTLYFLLFLILTFAVYLTHTSDIVYFVGSAGLCLLFIFLVTEIHHFKEKHIWKCSSCGEQGWDPKESFCDRCGGKMVWEKITPEFCPNGHEVKPYHKFCPK